MMKSIDSVANEYGIGKVILNMLAERELVWNENILGILYLETEDIDNFFNFGTLHNDSKSLKQKDGDTVVDFFYDDFTQIMIDCTVTKTRKLSHKSNFAVSELMLDEKFNSSDIREFLLSKFGDMSKKEIVRYIKEYHLGFKDKRMPMTDYGFLIEEIKGQKIYILCGYFPMDKIKVTFIVGLTFQDFKDYLSNPQNFKRTKQSDNGEYLEYKIKGFWRNQPYGKRNERKYRKKWISESTRERNKDKKDLAC